MNEDTLSKRREQIVNLVNSEEYKELKSHGLDLLTQDIWKLEHSMVKMLLIIEC